LPSLKTLRIIDTELILRNGYLPTRDGEVISHKGRKEIRLRPGTNRDGYKVVNLRLDGRAELFLVHRLVASFYIRNPEKKPYVNHIDTDKENNSAENLEWCTHKENMRHAVSRGKGGAIK